ncbi:MAG: HNH endonuclease, partial [Hormoscilla sp. SP5CHS1]|nr:HNH endonuclease [Hormoscilla sp. SP5CHS1]
MRSHSRHKRRFTSFAAQPKSLGGKDWYANLQLLHDYCHDAKSADFSGRPR